jgi:hypothetical protein
MDCEREHCLCTSEVGIVRDGRTFCSDHCSGTAASARADAVCECGHAGCASEEAGTALPVKSARC